MFVAAIFMLWELPVQVIQSKNEVRIINMQEMLPEFENSSFTVEHSDYLSSSMQDPITLLKTSSEQISFCPISQLTPNGQDVVIYLSLNSLLLIGPSTRQEISYDYDCYSVFQYGDQQFGVDCGSSFFLVYNYTVVDNVIKGFYLDTNTSYISEFETCIQRTTQQFRVQFEYLYFQYCSHDTSQDFTVLNNSIAQIFTSHDLIGCSQTGIIDQIFPNAEKWIDERSWNLGFTFKNSYGLCKCQLNVTLKCVNVFLQMFTPAYFTAIHTLNERTVLVAGNYQQAYILELSNSVEQQNTFRIIYKNVFISNKFQLIASSITNQYLIFVMAEGKTDPFVSAKHLLITKCLKQEYKNPYKSTVIKVYRTEQISQLVYYEMNSTADIVVDNLRDNLLIYDHQLQSYSEYRINDKLMQVQFNSDLSLSNSEDYIPYPLFFNMTFNNQFNSLTQNLSFLFCVTSPNNYIPQLVRDIGNGYQNCSQEKRIIKSKTLINQMDLIDGIMGPLLQFDYIPDPLKLIFMPYYLDYDYVAYIEDFNISKIGKILSAEMVAFSAKYDVFGTIIVTSTSKEQNDVEFYTCSIMESKSDLIAKPVNLTIDFCQLSKKITPSKQMQIDQFEIFGRIAMFVQYKFGIILMCIEDSCGELNTPKNNITLVKNELKSHVLEMYYFQILIQYENSNELQMYIFQFNETQRFVIRIIESLLQFTITQDFLGNQYDILQVDFTYLYEQTLMILMSDFTLYSIVAGPSMSVGFTNYSRIAAQMENPYCTGEFTGGFAIMQEPTSAQKSIVIWCTKIDQSFLVQFMLYTPSKIIYHRNIPTYGDIIDPLIALFATQSQFYVGVYTLTDYATYYIYDPFDFTPRTLVTQFSVQKSNRTIVVPVKHDATIQTYKDSTSMAIVLSDGQKSFMQFSNPRAKFFTHYVTTIDAHSTIQEQQILIGVRQPGQKLILYREYNITYELTDTMITSLIPIQASPVQNHPNLYLIELNESYFTGPIEGYTFTDNSNDVLQKPYAHFNKNLGEYINSFEVFGQVMSLIDLGSYDYLSLYNATNIQYKNLIIVVTKKTLLFVEKSSYKSGDPYLSCSFPSEQNSSNEECAVRILYPIWKEKLHIEIYEYCKVQCNQINQLILICFKAKDAENMHYMFLEFTYDNQVSSITVDRITEVNQGYLQNVFTDLAKPVQIAGNVYLVVVHSLYLTNSEVAVFNLDINPEEVVLNLIMVISNSTAADGPYQLIEDFDISPYAFLGYEHIMMVLLQETNLIFTIYSTALEVVFTISYPGEYLTKNYSQIFGQFLSYSFVSIISNSTYPNISLAIGNSSHILIINATLGLTTEDSNFVLDYTFEQYFYCTHQQLGELQRKPQILISNGRVQYVVSSCMKAYINYDGVFEEMIELYGFPNQNYIYLQLFIRGENSKSNPVQILSTYLVDLFQFLPICYQIYWNNKAAHLILSNSTYLLADFFVTSTAKFYLFADENSNYNLTAYNSQFQLSQSIYIQASVHERNNNMLAFYSIIVLLLLCFLIILSCVGYNYYINRKLKNQKASKEAITMELIEEQRESRYRSNSIFEDVVRQALIK